MRRKFFAGETYTNKYGTTIEIIEPYYNSEKALVKVIGEDCYFEVYRQLIRKGIFKSPLCRTVYGVGYLGEGQYRARTSEGVMIESYKYWANMLKRSYTDYPSNKDNCYEQCPVNESWYNYQNFARWFWENYKLFDGTGIKPYLDKDLLNFGNAKEYSEQNCCLIPQIINASITLGRSTKSVYGTGVKRNNSGTYTAFITRKSKSYRIGTFPSKEEAYIAFLIEKEKYIKSLAEEYKIVLREDVYNTLRNWKYEET